MLKFKVSEQIRSEASKNKVGKSKEYQTYQETK